MILQTKFKNKLKKLNLRTGDFYLQPTTQPGYQRTNPTPPQPNANPAPTQSSNPRLHNSEFLVPFVPILYYNCSGRKGGDALFRRRFRRPRLSPVAGVAPERDEDRGIVARMYIV